MSEPSSEEIARVDAWRQRDTLEALVKAWKS